MHVSTHALKVVVHLTLIPSNRERALSGLSALNVLRDLIAPSSEYPKALATRLTRETYIRKKATILIFCHHIYIHWCQGKISLSESFHVSKTAEKEI